MCGITGFIDYNKIVYNHNKTLKDMAFSLNHRGPDNLGYWISDSKKVFIGHARLSIRDLSEKSNQPITASNSRYVLTYNGEIYNALEIQNFIKKNYNFSFNEINPSDTIVLLKLLELNGLENSLKLINGMFAFFLLDQKKKTAYVVRDNFGQKPLYYTIDKNFFSFASELKALRYHPNVKLKLNTKSINHFLNYSYISAPETIFKNIFQLEPGSYLKIFYENLDQFDKNKNPSSQSSIEFIKWWSPKRNENKNNYKNKNIINEYEKLLFSSVKKLMVSDVPTGTFLSGGVDSGLITSVASKISKGKINTFTVGFSNPDFDESKISEKISKILMTNHHQIFLENKDILSIAEKLAFIYDEPFADSSQIPSIYLSNFAKTKITVALTGDGGDELFGGYNRYIYLPKIIKILRLIKPSIFVKFIKFYLKFPKFISEKLNTIVKNNSLSQIEDKLVKLLNSIEASKNSKELYFEIIKTNNSKYFKSYSDKLDYNFKKIDHSDLMFFDKINYLPNDILCKVDRATMFNSLESRAPFLSNEIADFAQKLNHEYLFRNNNGKFINREILSKFIPKKIFQIPKKGFGVPLNEWLKGPLKEWANYLFKEHKFGPSFDIDNNEVDKIWLKFKKLSNGNEKLIWNILILKSWDLMWNDRP